MEEKIRSIVERTLEELGAPGVPFVVEWPADLLHGDYAVNAALSASKVLAMNPRAIAEVLVPALIEGLGEDVATVTVAGPGFVNITLSQKAVGSMLLHAVAGGEDWGKNSARKGVRAMVEYGNPNPFKEMHIGHLTSTIIGEAISRLMEYSGAEIIRDTFGGDVGPHVAKALWALQKKGITDVGSPKEIGTAYIHGSNAYEESEEAKKEIDALNTRIYEVVNAQKNRAQMNDQDVALLTLWMHGREISMEEFRRIFGLLDAKFDYTFYDSDTTEVGEREVHRGVEKGIFEKSEGAIIYRGEKVGLNTLVFITSRGTPTYETKDIGLAYLKELQTETDEVYITTGAEQVGHFKIVLAALSEIAPALASKMHHIPHGLLQLTTGKMSSRKGNIITASDLIKEMTEKATEKSSDPVLAHAVGIAAIKYMILRSTAGSNIIFDPEKSLALDGDSGPYLQYALVRAKSILEKAVASSDERDLPEEPYALARLITRFPEVIKKAQELRAPHVVTQYLTLLAATWNSFYAQEKIIGGAFEAHKLDIVRAFVETMQNGLWVLAIPAPEKM